MKATVFVSAIALIARLRGGFGNHDGNGITDMFDLTDRHGGAGRHDRHRARDGPVL